MTAIDYAHAAGNNRMAEDLRTKVNGEFVRMSGMYDTMVIDLSALPQLADAFAHSIDGTLHELIGGLLEGSEVVMTDAKSQVPIDTGTLMNSGVVLPPVWEGDIVSVELGFGGAASSYAIHVHEDLQVHHKVGKAKFLEDPMRTDEGDVMARIEARIASYIGGF